MTIGPILTALSQTKLTQSEYRVIFVLLGAYHPEKADPYFSAEKIVKSCGMKRVKVSDVLRSLLKKGIVIQLSEGAKDNEYALSLTPVDWETSIKTKDLSVKENTPSQYAEKFFSMDTEVMAKEADYFLSSGVDIVVVRDQFSKFCLYWTEKTASGRKQRWQTEKTFEVRRRLVTWFERGYGRFTGSSRTHTHLSV